MEQSPSCKSDSSLARKEITPPPAPFKEPESPLPWHKSPPLVCDLIHMNPIHIHSQYLLKIRFNIILPSTDTSSL
jgi:hypothetical protein